MLDRWITMGQALVASIGALAFVLAFLYKMVAIEPRAVMESKRWIGRIVFGTLGVELAGVLVKVLVSAGSVLRQMPFVDPTPLIQLLISLISEALKQSSVGVDWVIEYYFLWTGNFHGSPGCLLAYARPDCAFTGNDVLRGLYRLMAVMADSCLAAIVTFSLFRSIFERSFRAKYTLKAMLPRLLLGMVLVNSGLFLMPGAINRKT